MDKEQKTCKTYKTLLYVPKAETIPINVHQLVNMLYYIHKTEYYPTIKRNKGLIRVTTWMNLKDIMINERNWV